MKNILQHLTVALVFLFLQTTLKGQITVSSENQPASTEISTSQKIEVSKQLESRLLEIRDMDKSGMTSYQKNALKNEVKEIKKKLQLNNGGVYLSVGAIIIIILLLILIL